MKENQTKGSNMVEITWLGHATFEIQFEWGEVLVLDPWITGNPAYPTGHEIKRADVIVVFMDIPITYRIWCGWRTSSIPR